MLIRSRDVVRNALRVQNFIEIAVRRPAYSTPLTYFDASPPRLRLVFVSHPPPFQQGSPVPSHKEPAAPALLVSCD